MRKYIILFLAILSCQISAIATDITLYTPNGHSVYAFTRSEEFTYQERLDMDAYWTSSYPNAEKKEMSTSTYNCHSYAWNYVEGGPICWLNQFPDLHWYWDDESYVETDETYAEKIFYYSEDHSAIQSEDSGWFISKWGSAPLMKHLPGDCPYDAQNLRYYAKYPVISGEDMIGGTEELEYSVSCIPKNTTVKWNYPSALLDSISATETSIVLKPKTYNTIGNATITANFKNTNNVVTHSAAKRIGVGGPCTDNVSIIVRRDMTNQIVYPSGVGLRPNAYYTATLSGATGYSQIEWIGDSNITIDLYTDTQLKFHTGSIPTTQLSVYGTSNRYGIRRNLIGVTLYGGID